VVRENLLEPTGWNAMAHKHRCQHVAVVHGDGQVARAFKDGVVQRRPTGENASALDPAAQDEHHAAATVVCVERCVFEDARAAKAGGLAQDASRIPSVIGLRASVLDCGGPPPLFTVHRSAAL